MRNSVKLVAILVALSIIALIATGCASAPTEPGEIRYEAEDAVIEGNIVRNAGPDNPENDGVIAEASGDFFYMQDSGSITWTVNAPSAGEYVVKIYYAIPTSYGDKMNHVAVNGTAIGEESFPATAGEWTAKWIQATLNEGENTISVSHSWGYTWFDYLTIEELVF